MEHDRNWTSSLLRGQKLREWATATAETKVVMKLSEARTAETAVELIQEVHEGAQHAMDTGPNLCDRDCKEGCPGCCHAMISVTAPEACVIATSVRDNNSPGKVDAIRQRCEEIADESKTMDNTEYAKAMIWCPLLGSNLACTVYQVRPLVCRAWNSFSREACHDCYFANHVCNTIPLDDHAYQVGQGVRSGLSSGLEAAGLDGNHYELSSVLGSALDTPDAAERWARGEVVFGDCRTVLPC